MDLIEPLEGKWKIGTTNIIDEYLGLHPFFFRREGTKLWAAFDFEECTGILLVDPAPTKASNVPLLCTWRGLENGEGEIQWLESECKGELVFLGGGKIIGHLDLYDVEFTATLDAKTKEPIRIVEDIRKEWKGYNEKAHAKEGRRRWGKCYDDDDDDDDDDEDDERESGSDEDFELHWLSSSECWSFRRCAMNPYHNLRASHPDIEPSTILLDDIEHHGGLVDKIDIMDSPQLQMFS